MFDSPRDRIVFDTGHQAYVHKILTGRAADFDTLRKEGGLSGYPSQAESPHDIVENSHASTSLSYADGLAKAYRLKGDGRYVVAVVGDGALTGGMSWEALNNIAVAPDSRLVIVVNDNGRSYTDTVGGLSEHLANLRTNPRYEQALELIKSRLARTKLVGPPLYDALHAIKKGLKDVLAPQGMFEDLGIKYVGTGRRSRHRGGRAVTAAGEELRRAGHRARDHPKGMGYPPAEQHQEDNLHSLGSFDAGTGAVPVAEPSYADIFRAELVALGVERADIVAVTAAMLYPTGLDGFQRVFPERTFDVGIAEQHAVTSAAGNGPGRTAPGGRHLCDLPQPGLRPGAAWTPRCIAAGSPSSSTGQESPARTAPPTTGCGTCRCSSSFRVFGWPRPGMRSGSVSCSGRPSPSGDAPTVLRVPKGAVPPEMTAIASADGIDTLVSSAAQDVLVVAVGAMAGACIDAAERLEAQGIGVTVVDPRWVKPVNPALVSLAREYGAVVSVEDNGRGGGCGSVLVQALADAGVETPVKVLRAATGVPGRRQASRHPRAGRSHRTEPGPRHHRLGGCARPRAVGDTSTSPADTA